MHIYLRLRDIDPTKKLAQLITEYLQKKEYRHECGEEFDELVFMPETDDIECNSCPRDEYIEPIDKIEIK